MALMSDERRKEMEEEMSRFELEIAPADEATSPALSAIPDKLRSPPLPPPNVTALMPEVLIKAPPPPPPPLSPPALQSALRPPPPPPLTLQPRPQATPPMRFIPPQLQRHPRPHPRHHFGMRGPPMGQPGPFQQQGPMGHFGPMGGPHMHPGRPLMHHPGGPPMHPGGHMGPMGPGGPMFHMGPGGMPMHPMGVNHPLPPGFCPPMGPPDNMNYEPQQFLSNQETNEEVPTSSSDDGTTSVASAPTIYAAPFKKIHSESTEGGLLSSNGKETFVPTSVSSVARRQDGAAVTKNTTNEPTVGPTIPTVNVNEEVVVSKKKDKKKKIVRMAGGQAWEDNSLLEWENDDFRIFCGDLGNDVTDEVLIRAFSKYPSFVKAKVVRDKRTNKTKGFGFVSFKDPQDFIKAMREMNGRYVGSRPIKLRKSTWRDRNIDLVKKKQREKEKLGLL